MGEQGLLSVVNFCATILLARFLAVEEFGAYALAFTLLTLIQGFQRALISIPIVVMCPNVEKLHANQRHWHKVQALLVITSLIILLAIFILMFIVVKEAVWLRKVLLALMILLMPMFYYEFYRRWLIQERKTTILLPMACSYTLVFSLTLWAIAIYGGTAIEGAAAMATAAALAALIGLFASSRINRRPLQSFFDFWQDLWRFSRWQVMSHVAYAGYNNLIPIIVSYFVGPSGVAVMNATRNIGQPVQTFVMAIDNVDKPRASSALAGGGVAAMRTSLRNTSRTLIVPGGLYLLAVGVFAQPALNFLFGGKYDHAVIELQLWLPVFFLILIAQPIESGLYVLKRSDVLFSGRIWAAVAGLTASLLLIPTFGVAGALTALTLGWLVSFAMAWRGLQKVTQEHHART